MHKKLKECHVNRIISIHRNDSLKLEYTDGDKKREKCMLRTSIFKLYEANFISETPSRIKLNINVKNVGINL